MVYLEIQEKKLAALVQNLLLLNNNNNQDCTNSRNTDKLKAIWSETTSRSAPKYD